MANERFTQCAQFVKDDTEGPNVTFDRIRLFGVFVEQLRCKVKGCTDFRRIFDENIGDLI